MVNFLRVFNRLKKVAIFEPIKQGNWLMKYSWQHKEWPRFQHDPAMVAEAVKLFSIQLERAKAVLSAFDTTTEEGKKLEAMVAEAVGTSAIEGEKINPKDVMSSMKNRLGQNRKFVAVRDYRASGVAEMMLRLRDEFAKPLSEKMLHRWHQILFRGYPVREVPEIAGNYRKDAVFIKSALLDDETIRFEAPPARAVPLEMRRFVRWFNQTEARGMDAAVRAALAHLWFESIHPYCDGNGRLGRALVGKVVAQSCGVFVMIPFSAGLLAHRQAYYDALRKASLTLDATEWICDFVALLTASIRDYENELRFQIRVLCIQNNARGLLNERQVKVFERMAREGAKGFAGGMNATKYQSMTRASKATATRDLAAMVKIGVLAKQGRGPGIRYQIRD